MHRLVVGDVHGMSDKLARLLRRYAALGGEHVTFLGDLVHRGPDSTGVIEMVAEMVSDGRAQVIVGNHDDRLSRSLRGNPTCMDIDERILHDTVVSSPLLREYWQLIEDSGVYFARHGEFLCVHGGLSPTVSIATDADPRDRRLGSKIMWQRYVDLYTHIAVNPTARSYSARLWAELYNGHSGHVLFGHQPHVGRLSPAEYPHATGLDLGACFGGPLCGLLLKDDKRVGYLTDGASYA